MSRPPQFTLNYTMSRAETQEFYRMYDARKDDLFPGTTLEQYAQSLMEMGWDMESQGLEEEENI